MDSKELDKLLANEPFDAPAPEPQDELYTLANGTSQLTDPEHSHIMFRLFKLSPHCSRDYTWDDIGTATLMQEIYDDEIRYCPQNRNWYIWEGRWKQQNEDGIVSDKLQTLLNILRVYCDEVEALHGDDEELLSIMKDYKKYVSSIRKYNAMRSILEVFKTMVRLPLYDMDNHPYLLNTTSGAIDLRTGKKIEDIRPYNLTKRTNTYPAHKLTVRFDRWYSFIDEITSHDKEKAAFLQRALGYSILGDNREECMFLAYGAKTRNGKGTLFTAVKKALSGEYADTSSSDLICEDSKGRSHDFNAPQPALAKIKSARLVEMSETEQGIKLSSQAVKAMTGRDELVARGLYEAPFTFLPQFTLWLSTNYLPAITDDSVFRSNRIWVVEFNENFAENGTLDSDLKNQVQMPENLPTVLEWLIDGCKSYLKIGLQPPACVIDATKRYRDRFDRVSNFIHDCCTTNDNGKVLSGALYAAYQQWCVKSENRYKPLGSQSFYQQIEMRGFPIKKSSLNYVYGLELSEHKEIQL